MGRNRTPTAIMDARGSFIANPRYARPDEPQGDRPLGGPPKWLSKEEKAVWKDLANQMLPGVVFFLSSLLPGVVSSPTVEPSNFLCALHTSCELSSRL